MDSTIEILKSELGQAVLDSGKMIGAAMVISLIIGGALGLLLYLTSSKLFLKIN